MPTEIIFNFGTADKPVAIRVSESDNELSDRLNAAAGQFVGLTAIAGPKLSAGEAVSVNTANISYMHAVS